MLLFRTRAARGNSAPVAGLSTRGSLFISVSAVWRFVYDAFAAVSEERREGNATIMKSRGGAGKRASAPPDLIIARLDSSAESIRASFNC